MKSIILLAATSIAPWRMVLSLGTPHPHHSAESQQPLEHLQDRLSMAEVSSSRRLLSLSKCEPQGQVNLESSPGSAGVLLDDHILVI